MAMKKAKGLIIEINRECNLNCKFCRVPKDNRRRAFKELESLLENKEMEDVVEYKEGKIKYLGISGGEPLLHPDILRILKLLSTKSDEVVLATNLTILNEKILDALKKLKNIYIQINLPSPNPSTYKKIVGKDTFSVAIKNIKKLTKEVEAYRVAINMVVCKENIDECKNMVKLCSQLNVENLRFHVNVGGNINHKDFLAKTMEAQDYALENDLPLVVRIASEKRREGIIPYITVDKQVYSDLFEAY